MQSCLHVPRPARKGWGMTKPEGPVDRGPWSWDRTSDGKLDEVPSERPLVKMAKYFCSPESMIVRKWIDSLPRGTIFHRATAQLACFEIADVERFRNVYFNLTKLYMSKGMIQRLRYGSYEKL